MKKWLAVLLCLASVVLGEGSKGKIVYVDIVGDLFHAGHVEFLKKAKSFGDYLIVGVLADEVVQGYKRDPIIPLSDRVKVIEACRYVDRVLIAPPPQLSKEKIRELGIDCIVHGDDIQKELMQEHYQSAIDLGIFHLVPYTPGISTSDIIQRVAKRHAMGEFQ